MTEFVNHSLILVTGSDADCQSAFTRVASLLGAALPKTQRAQAYCNPAVAVGASHPISAVNDRLLQRSGYAQGDGRWVAEGLPADGDLAEWREELRQVFAAEYGTRSLVVLNDPRLCPILPIFLEAAKAMQLSPRVIVPFRDPFESASSLQRRYGFTQEKGLLVWLRRVLQVELASRHSPRAFISCDMLRSNSRKAMKSAARSAEIAWPGTFSAAATEIDGVLSLELAHDGQDASITTVDPQASSAYCWAEEARSALLALQEDARDEQACNMLDRIGEELDAACVNIGDALTSDCEDLLFRQAAIGQSLRATPGNSRPIGFSWPGIRLGSRAAPTAAARMRKKERPVQVDFAVAVHRAPETAPAGRDICLLVGYAPDGIPTPALISLLDKLSAENVDCHVCLAVKDTALPVDISGLGAATGIFARANGGYDFAAWASLLQSYPALWTASRLLFVNDSIIPVRGLAELMTRLRDSDADFIALTESYEIAHHTQSYFFALQNEGLRSAAVRSFWNDAKVETDKAELVRTCEVGLLDLVRRSGHKIEILFPYEKLFPGASFDRPLKGNPTHYLWERLILAGFPFVKAELLHRNPARVWIAHCDVLLQSLGYDADLVRAHLTEMERTRPRKTKWSAIFKSRFYRLATVFVGNQGLRDLREWNHRRLRARHARRLKGSAGMPQTF